MVYTFKEKQQGRQCDVAETYLPRRTTESSLENECAEAEGSSLPESESWAENMQSHQASSLLRRAEANVIAKSRS